MLETIVTLILVLLLIVVFIGLSTAALLLMFYGPGAAAGFMTAVLAHRLGADPAWAIATGIVVFAAVTMVMRTLARGVIRIIQSW